MKHKRFIAQALTLLCAAVFFAGCGNPAGGGEEGKTFSVSVVASDGIKYYALRSGEAEAVDASQAATTDWDIAFSRMRLIFTNSGNSNSSGQGTVWYAGTTDFDSVTSVTAVNVFTANGKDYNVDTNTYIPKSGSGSEEKPINVMTYVGYTSGTGTSTDPYQAPNLYNQDQYYSSPTMGTYTSTGNVYIIKHGDGSGHSKIQIAYEYVGGNTPADNFSVKYKKLD
ncbi:MAG: HmuY family protein [Spirochaetaceae bacterium]|jgi:hypothetical protein|nr:HmuY family protein [Spirochaetaceae bacterium]